MEKKDIENVFYSLGFQAPPPPNMQGQENDNKIIAIFSLKGKQKLHPKARWLFFFMPFSLVASIVPFIAFASLYIAIRFAIDGGVIVLLTTLSAIFVVGVLFVFWWSKMSYKNYAFEFGEELFKKESGVISKHYVSIPYSRIQNVDIHRGLLDRFLGLSRLYIQTAGSSLAAEGVLPGLEPRLAEKLRGEIMEHVNQFKDQGI